MNPEILIISLEGILLLILIAVGLFLHWRKKQQQATDFNHLLDDINDRQPQRLTQLKRRLDEHPLLNAQADELSGQFITAEKLFLQQFVEQQLHQKSVAGFYEHLIDLLDNYLTPVLKETTIKPAQPATVSENHPEQPSAESPIVEPKEQTIADLDKTDKIQEEAPAWGDVFD